MKQIIKRIIQATKLDNSTKKELNLGNPRNNDLFHISTNEKTLKEINKEPKRYDVINLCLNTLNRETTYLEIGVRYPEDNFDKIESKLKYSVDPGIENEKNPVDFKLTSDAFFAKLKRDEILSKEIKFDVIFIDGLHLAEQVERDIANSLNFMKEDGFVILHDCNPPTEFHAREEYGYLLSPATGFWNGTTWKAFFKYRSRMDVSSCCVDADWGIGVLSKKKIFDASSTVKNPFYEFKVLEENRKNSLGLISYFEFQQRLVKPNYI